MVEFDQFKNEAGHNYFTMTPKKRTDGVNAIGIVSKAGKYNGSTYAYKDIALQFASWIPLDICCSPCSNLLGTHYLRFEQTCRFRMFFTLTQKNKPRWNRGFILRGGPSRDRTGDTRIFSPLLLPSELPGHAYLADHTRFELVIFSVTGRHVGPLHQWSKPHGILSIFMTSFARVIRKNVHDALFLGYSLNKKCFQRVLRRKALNRKKLMKITTFYYFV